MAQMTWIKGTESPNPGGRPKHSVRTVAGMVERIVKKHFSAQKMNRIIEGLTVQQKAEMYLKLLPFVMAPKRSDSLSEDELFALYERLEKKVTDDVQGKKAAG
jgi:hypothetical protein